MQENEVEAAKFKLFLGIVVALAAVGVGAAYFLSRDAQDVATSNSQAPKISVMPGPKEPSQPPQVTPDIESIDPLARWVNATNLNVRTLPDPTSPSLGTLGNGTAFSANAQTYVADANGATKLWYRGNGTNLSGMTLVGWVKAEYLSREPQVEVTPTQVTPAQVPPPPQSPPSIPPSVYGREPIATPLLTQMRLPYMGYGWYVQLGYANWYVAGEVEELEARITCVQSIYGDPNVIDNSLLRPRPKKGRKPAPEGWYANYGPFYDEAEAINRAADVNAQCAIIKQEAYIIAQIR
jgi:hypothetical protein